MCHFLILLCLASATASILVPHSTANVTPWTQQQCVPNMNSLSHSLGHVSGAVMDVTSPRTCNTSVQTKHFPCQFHIVNQYVRRCGLLQQMNCILQKHQIYYGYILTSIIHHACKRSVSERQELYENAHPLESV